MATNQGEVMKVERHTILVMSDLQSGATQMRYITDEEAYNLEKSVEFWQGEARRWQELAHKNEIAVVSMKSVMKRIGGMASDIEDVADGAWRK